MKNIVLIFIFLLFVSSCADGGGNGNNNNSLDILQGIVPADIINKKLEMTRNGATYLSVTHFRDGALINNQTVDYEKYPPKYTYTRLSKTTAKYHLEVMRKTYIPLYGTYTYNKFIFDYTLNFSVGSGQYGTFTGTETNSNGAKTNKNGSFTLTD